MSNEELQQILRYYQDIGIKDVYRKAGVVEAGIPAAAAPVAEPPRVSAPAVVAPPPAPPAPPPPPPAPVVEQPALIAMSPELPLPPLTPSNDTLALIQADIGDCKRCRLHTGRKNIVFGVGNPETKLVFVGEGPGEDEDIQGIPFVGRAGQLLTAMIENTAQKEGIPLKRADVYICNVVKCRPPNNRTPETDEMEMCGQFLARQLEVIKPKAICSLGGTATKALLGKKEGVTKLRGNWFKWRDIPVMVTYHPSYLLRSVAPAAKREAWEDLKKVLHFCYD